MSSLGQGTASTKRAFEVSTSGANVGFWAGGYGQLLDALEDAEAEAVTRLEEEFEQAGDRRRKELEQELNETRARYQSRRWLARWSFF